MDIGLDHPGAQDHLERQLQVINIIGELHQQLATYESPPPSSALGLLIDEFPDAPVHLGLCVSASLDAARGALDQIGPIVAGQLASSRIVLQALLRVALVSAGRVVFVLGPDDQNERRSNAAVILAQESRSMMQAIDAFADFTQHGLRPDTSYVAEHRRLHEITAMGAPRRGDGRVLQAMAKVIAKLLVAEEHVLQDGDNPQLLSEQITWTWHTYSGLAHGYAWPRLLPTMTGDRAMPGDYLADLGIVVGVAHLAFQKTIERVGQESAGA